MYKIFHLLFKVIINIILITSVNCDCTKTYAVFCEDVSDYMTIATSEYWKHLIVGNTTVSRNEYDAKTVLYLTKFLPNLEIFTIINQEIETLIPDYSIHIDHKLKTFNVYDSEYEKVNFDHFLKFRFLKELNIVDSNVKSLKLTFTGGIIEYIDLSKNLLKSVKSGIFSNIESKVLSLRKNMISHIAPQAFSGSLEFLDLSANALTSLSGDVFENLKNLKMLVLRSNKLQSVPHYELPSTIQLLDFAENDIDDEVIDLRRFQNLFYIDLSTNNLNNEFDISSVIPRNNLEKQISLAYNGISCPKLDGDLNNLNCNVTMVLFGNPLRCNCTDKITEVFENSRIRYGQCEKQLRQLTRIPTCTVAEEFTGNFQEVIEKLEEELPCNVWKDMWNLRGRYVS